MADPSIILLCGVGSGTWIYDDLAKLLPGGLEVSRATIADLAGSPSDQGGIMHRAIAGLRTRIGNAPGQVIVVAHSLGGAIALAAAEEMQDNLAGLVLIDAGPRWTPPALRFAAERDIEFEVERLLPSSSASSLDQSLREWVAGMVIARDDRERLLADFRSAEPVAFRKVLTEGRKLQLRLDPRRLRKPMLVIAACSERINRQATMNEFRDRYAGSLDVILVPVQGARHYVMLDRPRQMSTTLTHYLQSERLGLMAAVPGRGAPDEPAR